MKKGAGTTLFLLMNPSTVDAENFDDPTVAKCQRMARHWGMTKVFIANVCAYCSTSRLALLDIEDPVGPRNRQAILEMAALSDMIVVAHGIPPGTLHIHGTPCAKPCGMLATSSITSS